MRKVRATDETIINTISHYDVCISCGSTRGHPVGYTKDNYWFCKSVGHAKDKKIVALSGVFTADPTTEYLDIEDAFLNVVYDQIKDYKEAIPARCVDYESEDLAKKHRARQEHMTKKDRYEIEGIDFP